MTSLLISSASLVRIDIYSFSYWKELNRCLAIRPFRTRMFLNQDRMIPKKRAVRSMQFLSFAHHFVIYWLFQNGANKNQHQESHQRDTIPDKFVFFLKVGKAKKSIGWAKYVHVCEWDTCWRSFCNFSLVTKNVKSSPFLQMSAILKFHFQKRKQ